MKDIFQIKRRYDFTDQDARNLSQLRPAMEQHKKQAADRVYDAWIVSEDQAKSLEDKDKLRQAKEGLAEWFVDLFNGEYDGRYLASIKTMGSELEKLSLDLHYINSSIHLIRMFCLDILGKQAGDLREQRSLNRSVQKILDLNLDVISSCRQAKETNESGFPNRLHEKLVHLAEGFSFGLNLTLVIILMGVSLGVVGLLGYDIWHIAHSGIEHGVTAVMGTLLMLWVMIELMETEIKHLKEGKFSISVFIEVVLVAFIRDALVATLEHGELNKLIFLVGAIVALGVVYWLISLADAKRELRRD